MNVLIFSLVCALSLEATASDFVSEHARRQTKSALPITTVHQFGLGDWPEALAFRPNGQLLINLLSRPDIYQIDVVNGTAVHVASIPQFSGLYGLTEVESDQFYIAGGNFILSNSTHYHGTYSVWHLNMTNFDSEYPGSAALNKVADFPLAALNGLTTLDNTRGLILVPDTDDGVIYTLNVYTGANSITIDDPVLKVPANATIKFSLNGINVRDGAVFFTNTGAGTFGKVPINTQGNQTGPGVIIATTPQDSGGDDWTFDKCGNAYIADDPNNWVNLVRNGSHSTQIIIGGPNSTAVQGPTSAKFGISKKDRERRSLYVTSSGGIAQYETGNFTVPGRVYRVDTAALGLC